MNIVFVTYHTCARANKMARALIAAGHQVIVLQHLAASESMLYQQQLSSFYRDKEDLAEKVDIFNDWADVFHVHNEPDWPVWVTTKAAADHIPVIYDCHDLGSQRKGVADDDEYLAMNTVDACIFPSLAYLAGAAQYHDLDPKKFLMEIVYSMCLASDRPSTIAPKIDAIVYEGHHIAPMKDTDFKPGHPLYYEYRDYREFVQECSIRGIPTALYGTKPDFESQYRVRGALVNRMLTFQTMLNEISRYSWGFCGHPDDHPQWQKAMPNKLFEYLAAGLPVIAWNCEEVEAWVREYDIGVVVKNYNELKEAFDDEELRIHLAASVHELKTNGHFDMEIQLPKIIGLYEKAIDLKEVHWDESDSPPNRVQSSDN